MIRSLRLPSTLLRRCVDPSSNHRSGRFLRNLPFLAIAVLLGSCSRNDAETAPDRVVLKGSDLPTATEPGLVGSHPVLVRYGLGDTYA